LKGIRKKLDLSQPLNLGSARDCYANTLDKNNTDIKKISQMLGHSNVVITEHYLAGLNPDVTFGINDPIL
jgi:site-specific recombinase XerD